jgi:hypothetical protein
MQFLYWVLKNRVLQTWKVSINHWNEQKKSLVNLCPRTSACLDMGDFHVTLQLMLFVVSVHVSTTFNLPWEVCTILKIPSFTWISLQVFSTHCCNTTVLQPRAEYIRVFRCPCIVRQHLDQTCSWQRIECGDPINWLVWSLDLNALNFWLWGHLKASAYLDTISNLEMLQQSVENTHWEIRVKPRIFERVHSTHEKNKWKFVLSCMGTTQSICCWDNLKITHIAAGIGFCTYVDWEFFAHMSEYYKTWKSVTPPYYQYPV